jgi:hypothetical protein
MMNLTFMLFISKLFLLYYSIRLIYYQFLLTLRDTDLMYNIRNALIRNTFYPYDEKCLVADSLGE